MTRSPPVKLTRPCEQPKLSEWKDRAQTDGFPERSRNRLRGQGIRTLQRIPERYKSLLLGVEDDLRTLPPRLMEEIAALSASRIGEP